MDSTEQKLYNQAVYDTFFHGPDMTFQEYLEKQRKQHREDFKRGMGAYTPTSGEKENMENTIGTYLMYVGLARKSFDKDGFWNERNKPAFETMEAKKVCERWIDEAYKANLNLYNLHIQMGRRAQEGLHEQVVAQNQAAVKNKSRAKTLKALGLAAAVGAAAVWGTKAVMDKVSQNSDKENDRIEYRQGNYFATDTRGQFIESQDVPAQRPQVGYVEEIVEEVVPQPMTTVQEETVEQVQQQVVQNQQTYQSVMQPQTVLQPQPVAQTVVAQPSVQVVSAADTLAVVDDLVDLGANIAILADDHYHHGPHYHGPRHMPMPRHHVAPMPHHVAPRVHHAAPVRQHCAPVRHCAPARAPVVHSVKPVIHPATRTIRPTTTKCKPVVRCATPKPHLTRTIRSASRSGCAPKVTPTRSCGSRRGSPVRRSR